MRSGYVAGLSLLFGAVSGAAAIFGTVSPVSAQSVRALTRVGLNAELAEEYDLAEDMWRQASAQNPNNADLSVSLGNTLLTQERWAEAEAVFLEGIQLASENEPAEPEALYLGLGAALRAQGQSQAAKAAFETAIQTNDQVPFGYSALGRLLRDYGELEGAADAFSAIIQLEPVAPHGSAAFWNLGKVRVTQGQLGAAEQEYRRAIALEPNRVEFHQSLATLLRSQGRTQEASQVANKILRLNNENAELLAKLEEQPLLQAYGTEDYRQQAENARALLEQYPMMVQAYLELGSSLLKLGQFVDSTEALIAATELSPDNPLAQYLLSLALADMGEEARSDSAYQTALALYPDIGQPGVFRKVSSSRYGPLRRAYVGFVQPVPAPQTLSARLSRLPSFQGNFSTRLPTASPAYLSSPSTLYRAIPLEAQLALNPDDGYAHLSLAGDLARDGKIDEATEAYQAAAQLDPSQAYVAYNNLGAMLVEQEQFDEAIAAFRSAISSAKDNVPSDPENDVAFAENIAQIYTSLGTLLRKQGLWEDALATYEETDAFADFFEAAFLQSEGLTAQAADWERQARSALISSARSSAAAGQYQPAEAAYLEALELYPDIRPMLSDELATLLFRQGNLPAANAAYTDAIRNYPDQAYQLAPGLAVVLRAQGREAEADSLIAAYPSPELVALPPIPSPTPLLPSVRRRNSSIQRGIPTARRIPTVSRRLPSLARIPTLSVTNPLQMTHIPLSAAYENFGQVRLSQGRYAHAESAFSSSLSSTPYHLGTLVNYGLSFVYQGERDRATEIFNQALNTVPDEINCYVFSAEEPAAEWQPEDYLQTGEACISLLLD